MRLNPTPRTVVYKFDPKIEEEPPYVITIKPDGVYWRGEVKCTVGGRVLATSRTESKWGAKSQAKKLIKKEMKLPKPPKPPKNREKVYAYCPKKFGKRLKKIT